MIPETQDSMFQIKLALNKLDPRISLLIEFSLDQHLQRINPRFWSDIVEEEAEELIVSWLKDIDDLQRRELPQFTKPRMVTLSPTAPEIPPLPNPVHFSNFGLCARLFLTI